MTALLELAVDLMRRAAAFSNQECCAHTTEDSVCVIREGHAGEHRFETARSIVPFE
jgi:hypothetical protein